VPPPSTDIRKAFASSPNGNREVLVLVARSLSNEDIAAALFVSLATVKTHVNRILGKLDLRSRA
jgi:DNA-binding NarL/FixJ family response regulator